MRLVTVKAVFLTQRLIRIFITWVLIDIGVREEEYFILRLRACVKFGMVIISYAVVYLIYLLLSRCLHPR